jgi:small subunit ribosomal protein S21
MLIVNIKSGENIERALKTFKSKVIKTKLNQELSSRKEFVKPSVKKRNVLLKAIYIEKKRNS